MNFNNFPIIKSGANNRLWTWACCFSTLHTPHVELFLMHTTVAGPPVEVGVTMYVLSISSVSEVLMVHTQLFHNTGVTWALTFKCWFLMVVVKLCVSLPHVPLQPHDFVVCWPPNPSQLQWHLPLMIYSGMIVSRKWKALLHHRHVKMAAWPVLLQNFLKTLFFFNSILKESKN